MRHLAAAAALLPFLATPAASHPNWPRSVTSLFRNQLGAAVLFG